MHLHERPLSGAGLRILGASPSTGALPAGRAFRPPSREDDLSETLWAKHRRRSLKDNAAFRSSSSSACLRPPSREEDFSETLWSKQNRRLLKDNGRGGLFAAAESSQAILERKRSEARPEQRVMEAMSQPSALATLNSECGQAGSRALHRARAEASAKSCACMEDLICFLEMHQLSGAYALALTALGIQDLSQLLALSKPDLDELLQKFDIDAMDEIILRGALRM